MLQENILYGWPWILLAIAVLAIVLSMLGKISPKLTVGIGLTCGLLFLAGNFLNNISNQATPTSDEKNTIVDANKKFSAADSLMQKIPIDTTLPGYSEPDVTFAGNTGYTEPIERNYKIKDRNYWTYRTAGKWKWSDKFKQDLFIASQWAFNKNGSYTIEINHTGNFNPVNNSSTDRYLYGGGEVEVKVNEKVCCCHGSVQIPKGIKGKSLPDIKQKIQEKMTNIISENDEFIFNKIISCLQ